MNAELISSKPKDQLADRIPLVQPEIEPASVVSQALPTQMGGIVVGLFALGKDSKMYMWDGQKRQWIFA